MIADTDNGFVLAAAPRWARMPWTRLRGMILRRFSEGMDAMVFPRCRSIHTCFMGMAIDVVFLDEADRIVRCVRSIPPWRTVVAPRKAVLTVELPAGTLCKGNVSEGDRLTLR